MNLPAEMKVSDLQLGDVIRLHNECYSDATVYRITETNVHIVRPYIQTADFTYTGGVITYIGQEDFSLWLKSDTPVTLLRRHDPEGTRKQLAAIKADIIAHLDKGQLAAAREKMRLL